MIDHTAANSKSVNSPVKQAEKQINATENQQLFVNQLVDASLPPEQEFGEATKSGIGYFEGVRDGHGCVYSCLIL